LARKPQARAVESLQSVLQHRTVDLFQYIKPHLDTVIGIHSDDVAIERSVMKLAERETIRYLRLALRVAIRDDVCGFKQLLMPQPANRAVLLVGSKDALTERLWWSRCRTCRVA